MSLWLGGHRGRWRADRTGQAGRSRRVRTYHSRPPERGLVALNAPKPNIVCLWWWIRNRYGFPVLDNRVKLPKSSGRVVHEPLLTVHPGDSTAPSAAAPTPLQSSTGPRRSSPPIPPRRRRIGGQHFANTIANPGDRPKNSARSLHSRRKQTPSL